MTLANYLHGQLNNGAHDARDTIELIDKVVKTIVNNEGTPEDIAEINKALRLLIDHVIYSKEGDNIELEITYL